jgi:hypothetical protein
MTALCLLETNRSSKVKAHSQLLLQGTLLLCPVIVCGVLSDFF